MPGVYRYTIDRLIEQVKIAQDFGLLAIALFPVVPPSLKNVEAKEAINPNNLICRAVTAIKSAFPSMGIICDVALDPYTSHGHDGLFINNDVDNDKTIDLLIHQSINQAKAGCDILAPSDMMDGRIGRLRQALDSEGLQKILLLSYAAKYASAYYGPFRDAIGSKNTLKGGDKKTYQMNPSNSDEALHEVALDIAEGADMVMIKPGLPYLDIVRRVKDNFAMPTFVYQVSGEYSMIQSAISSNILNSDQVILETLMAFKRAGADAILSYFALQAAQLMRK
jgi:porphobilinogen synthase